MPDRARTLSDALAVLEAASEGSSIASVSPQTNPTHLINEAVVRSAP
jgi:hypothetical protein